MTHAHSLLPVPQVPNRLQNQIQRQSPASKLHLFQAPYTHDLLWRQAWGMAARPYQ